MQCVYLLQEIDFDGISPTGLYKIGKTSRDAEIRKRQYQAGNARRVDTLHTIQVLNAQIVETELHRCFSARRIIQGGGDEWFYFGDVDINEVITFMDNYDETPVYETYDYSYKDSYSYGSDSSYDDWDDNWVAIVGVILICLGLLFGGNILSQRVQSTSARIDIPVSAGYAVVNLRSHPRHGDEFVIGQVRHGEQIVAYETSLDGQWRRIKLPDARPGWVANNFIK